MKKKHSYSAKDIEILEGLEPVRKRPGMYIGNIEEEGLHHLVGEVLDNSIDEVLSGNAKNISFYLAKDNFITIKDDGRGIPIDFHPKYKNKRAIEIVLTTLHSGGKFSNKIYQTSGGLHGVGISVVNALSDTLEVKVYKKNKLYHQIFKQGKPKGKIVIKNCNKNHKGTEIKFKPDNVIFNNLNFSPEKLFIFLQSKAFLVKGTNITWQIDSELIKKNNVPKLAKFYYPNGFQDYFKDKFPNSNKIFLHDFQIQINFGDNEKCEIFISFNEKQESSLGSYCNTIHTPDGGSHENALKNAVIKSLKEFGKKNQLSKIVNIGTSDIFDFTHSIISIFTSSPSFEGQTKKRVSMPIIQKRLEIEIQNNFLLWLNRNKKNSLKLANILIDRSLMRKDLIKIKEFERKTAKEKNRLPGKLVDCSSKSIIGTELFIVEGDSAGGTAKQARNREKQAILPLRGKILNVYNASISKITDNIEIQNLIQALGCGIGKNFQHSKLRYEKIIIMTDADVDGSHITTLLITFFYKFMKRIISNGEVYLAMPPLYKIFNNKTVYYAYNEKEKNQIIKNKFKNNKNLSITRFKGLGEMPANLLRDTTMDVNKRKLIKINLKNDFKDNKKTEKIFELLMGKKPEFRYKFIIENANFTNYLDY